jgi:hypothetical protein
VNGYWWEVSMRQVEVSRTLVFDDPGHAPSSFEHWYPTTSGSAGRMRSTRCSGETAVVAAVHHRVLMIERAVRAVPSALRASSACTSPT